MADEAASLVVRITGDAAQLESTISSVERALQGLETSGAGVGGATQRAFNNAAKNAEKTGKALKETGEAIDQVAKPLYTTSLALAAGGVASAKFAIDFENNFAAVKKTVEGTPEELEAVKKGIIALTTTGINGRSAIPATTADLAELAATAGQLGFAANEVVDFTEVMAQMESATNLGGETGAQTMARFMNVTKTAHGEVRNLGSAIVYLGNNYETTEAEIASMGLRLGRTGTLVGMGAADVLGYSTALSSMGIEAEAGGTAVSKSWTKIDNAVATGGKSLKAFAKVSGKSADEFSQLWKKDAAAAFNEFLGGLQKADNLPLLLQNLGINEVRESDALKALAIGYDKVKAAVSDANKAWAENTALQKEADAMAETTAGQLAIAKNNLVETARSMGELMLPTIASASTTVAGFAQKLAGMSDESKQALVKTGAGIIGLGLATKGVAGTIKTVGDTIEGYGKLKSLFSTGGALAKFAPGLKGIASAAGPAAIGIAGLTTAVIIGKKAYEHWYDSTYRFSDGLKEQAYETEAAADKWKKLNDLQWEYGNLKSKVNSGVLKGEDFDNANARLKEIENILTKEYKINLDSGDIDAAIEKAKKLSELELINKKETLKDTIRDKESAYQKAVNELPDAEKAYKEAAITADKYANTLLDLSNAHDKWNGDAKKTPKFVEAINSALKKIGREDLLTEEMTEFGTNYERAYQMLKLALENEVNNNAEFGAGALEELQGKIADWQAAIVEYKEAVQSLNEVNLLQFKDALAKNDTESADAYFSQIANYAQKGLIDKDAFARDVAAVQTGINSIDDAVNAGGTKLDAAVSHYIDNMKAFGAGMQETAVGASLLKNGFKDIGEAANAGKLDVIVKQANELGHNIGLIPENKNIVINADGDISFIEDVKQAVDAVNSEGNVTLNVSANGDISVLETADARLKELADNGDVKIKFNVDTGGFDIFNLQGNKLGEITANGTVTWESDSSEVDSYKVDNKHSDVVFGVDDAEVQAYKAPLKKGTVIYEPAPAPAPSVRKNATGTQNFPGGLAMVNDQRGISDPRELIVDNGRAFIPDGRDVILPLSKGAKVYTAKQTHDIMNNLGIPRYAKGKDNSDAFITARDNYSHYTKTNAVTTSQELEKWVEFSKQFKDNVKDVEDIEEQIFSLMRKQRQELNNVSKEYIEMHAALNDWEDIGDDPLAAYSRAKERNLADFNAGRSTWDEYVEDMAEVGKATFDSRIDQSKKWLSHEEKYNDLSFEDYVDGLRRMQAYTQEYYDRGLIDARTYRETLTELDEEYLDRYKENQEKLKEEADARVDAYFKSADNYYKIRETFGDWDEVGDSKIRFYTAELANIERMRREGDLEWQDYMDYSMDKYLELYKSYEEAYDDKLQDFKDQMSEISSSYADMRTDLQSGWAQEDRDDDLDEVNRLLGIYKNAVTDSGLKKYNELLEQKKQLERDQELADLEKEEKEALDKMQVQYDSMETEKKKVLKDLRSETFNVFSGVKDVNVDTSNIKQLAGIVALDMKDSIDTESHQEKLLELLLTAANKIATKVGTSKTSSNIYNNNGVYNIASANSQAIIKQLTGTIASGLGSAMIG